MTNTEAIYQMLGHLIIQGERCVVNNLCKYQHKGKKCAIGALIPEGKYQTLYDAKSYPPERLQEEGVIPKELNIDMLLEAQKIHDPFEGGSKEEWYAHVIKGFKELLKEYGEESQCL